MSPKLPNRTDTSTEEIQLPTLTSPKSHDYAASKITTDIPDVDRDRLTNATRIDHDESGSDLTDSEDEFDWDAEDDARSEHHKDLSKSRRGRAIWLAFMRLSRTFRTLIVGAIGAGILITPLLVFQLRFNSSPARRQAHVWSLWLTIVWAASCVTYLVVDWTPTIASGIIRLFSHSFERMKITIEVRGSRVVFHSSGLICVAYRCSSRLAEIDIGRYLGLDCTFSHPCSVRPPRELLDNYQPRYASLILSVDFASR
jgi:hypothetical protein